MPLAVKGPTVAAEGRLKAMLQESRSASTCSLVTPAEFEAVALSAARRGRRKAVVQLQAHFSTPEQSESEADPEDSDAFTWQRRLLANRFLKCTDVQILEALRTYAGDTDKAAIICERYARQSDGQVTDGDLVTSVEVLENMDLDALMELARGHGFELKGSATELRNRLGALLGLSKNVMIRLEWVLDAALAADLPSIDHEGAATIRTNVAQGRFSAQHYISMYTERLYVPT